MPYIAQVAIGNKPSLTIFGNDYDTPDGTGISVKYFHFFLKMYFIILFILQEFETTFMLWI